MSETLRKENKMGYMPIPKLLTQMSLPMVLSMLVQSLYNIVDSIFVAQISENALTAVSLAFPMQSLIIAIAGGTCVGMNALLSRKLGEKDYDGANHAAGNGIFLALVSYVVTAVVGTLAVKPFLSFQTNDPEILAYGEEYLVIVCICCVGVYMQITFERLLQATGRTFFSMISQAVGAVINIIMDPILIFGWFGLPKMGIAGAAIATVFGQIIGMLLGLFFNLKYNHDIHLSWKGLRPIGEIISEIYRVGIPSIFLQALGSVTTFCMNKILIQFTSTATAVLGVYFKLNSFVFMPVFGMNNGMVPIIAYNYGANNQKRVMHTIKLSTAAAMCIMLLGLAIFLIFPAQLLSFFNASEDMLKIGIPALRIIALSFSFAGFCISLSSVYQALGNGMYSLIVSVCRQILVLLPAAFILAKVGGLDAVWWCYPIAEIVSVLLNIYLFRRIYQEKISLLGVQ